MHYYDFYRKPSRADAAGCRRRGADRRLLRWTEISAAHRRRNGAGMRGMRCCARRSASWRNISAARARALPSSSRRTARRSSARCGRRSPSVGFGKTIAYARTCAARGLSGQCARSGRCHRAQPDQHHRALPPHRRFEWRAHRLRRRPGEKARAPGLGKVFMKASPFNSTRSH